ncbi:MAG: hypothetical protein AAF713_16045 [Pseudomonadota bacterium]
MPSNLQVGQVNEAIGGGRSGAAVSGTTQPSASGTITRTNRSITVNPRVVDASNPSSTGIAIRPLDHRDTQEELTDASPQPNERAGLRLAPNHGGQDPHAQAMREEQAKKTTAQVNIVLDLNLETRQVSISDVKVERPSTEFDPKHVRGVCAILCGGAVGGGLAYGGVVVGSIVLGASVGGPVGAVVGGVVGLLLGGFLVDKLVQKFTRQTKHFAMDQAMQALELQDIKLSQKQADRLSGITNQQWSNLLDYVDDAAKNAACSGHDKVWVRSTYIQSLILAAAKGGFEEAAKEVKALSSIVEIAKGADVQDLAKQQVCGRLSSRVEARGGQKLICDALAGKPRNVEEKLRAAMATIDARRADFDDYEQKIANKYDKDVGQKFGLIFRWQRHEGKDLTQSMNKMFQDARACEDAFAEIANHFSSLDDNAKEEAARSVLKIYAGAIACGQLVRSHVMDDDGRLKEEIVNELVRVAYDDQRSRAFFGKAALPEMPLDDLRASTGLLYKLRDLDKTAGDGRTDLARRFVQQTPDLFAQCKIVAAMDLLELAKELAPPGVDADERLLERALVLHQIAKQCTQLEGDGIDEREARILLRLQMDVGDAEPELERTGSDKSLSRSNDPSPPSAEAAAHAHRLVAWTDEITAALQQEPDLQNVSGDYVLGMVADIHQSVVDGAADQAAGAGFDEMMKSRIVQTLTEDDCARFKELIRANVSTIRVMHAMEAPAILVMDEDAQKLRTAISCVALGVDARDLESLDQIPQQELHHWMAAGFTFPEILAYRNNVTPRIIIERDGQPAEDRSPISPDSELFEILKSFKGSNLRASEVIQYIEMDLYTPELRAAKPRQRRDSIVESDVKLGSGNWNTVRERVIKGPGGRDIRVFKPAAFDRQTTSAFEARALGANIASGLVDEALGFDVLAKSEIAFREDQIGVTMPRVEGHTAKELLNGEAFLPIPNNTRYGGLVALVEKDRRELGAISPKTRKFARKEFGFEILRIRNGQLEACGTFLTTNGRRWNFAEDATFREKAIELQIVDFLNDELDRHPGNFMLKVVLGENGPEVIDVKGIDNDSGYSAISYVPQTDRTLPRVMSRRMVESIVEAYHAKEKGDGQLSQIKFFARDSYWNNRYAKVDPKVLPLTAQSELVKRGLMRSGDQSKRFDARLDVLYRHVTSQNHDEILTDNVARLKIIEDNEWGSEDIRKVFSATCPYSPSTT